MRPSTLTACATLCAALFLSAALHAQSFASRPCGDTTEDHSFLAWIFNSGEQACEMRSTTFALAGGHLNINSQNGGIEVIGEDRQDVALEARVSARAGSVSEAASILHEITIATGSLVEAHGPHTYGNHNWSVNYKLRVPHHLAAELHSLNGALKLTALDGNLRGDTTNGSLSLDRLAGDVHFSTTNGSIHATLEGSTWHGAGLQANTTNGSVQVSASAHYAAHLVASTTNGILRIDAPGIDPAQIRRHSVDTNLGAGGPTIRFETTNGSVSVQ